DVAPFVVAAEAVDEDEVGAPCLIERRRQHRADKAAAAGDDQHVRLPATIFWSSFPRKRDPKDRRRAGRPWVPAFAGMTKEFCSALHASAFAEVCMRRIVPVVEWPSTRSISA